MSTKKRASDKVDPDPETAPETAAAWTVAVQTRISPAAQQKLARKLSTTVNPSYAAYLRRLIYLDLGLITKES